MWSDGTALPATTFQKTRRARSWWQFTAFLALFVVVVVASCTVGSVFGWVKYFSDDGFAPQFALIEEQDAALQDAINAERAARIAEDTVLAAEQAALQVLLNAEIANRTAEDALLLALVNAEIAARTAAQQALNDGLDAEIAAREAFDTLAFAELANLTARLASLTAYNVLAQQEFISIYNSLTLLESALATEVADRTAAENVLIAQNVAQQNFIVAFAAQLAAEIATRTSQGETQLAEIAAILDNGILTINNQSALNHNFDFLSGNPGFIIGSGGTNIITITNRAIASVSSITPDPVTRDISILADGNVLLTLNTNSLNFGLVNIPAPPNYRSYHGSWAGSSVECQIPAQSVWFFDAYNIAAFETCTPYPFINNYNTYNGFGWEVPLSGGVGYGVWLVRVTQTLTVNYGSTPFGVAYSMGLCVNSYSVCSQNPENNEPQASMVWQMATPDVDMVGWGLGFQDHIFKATRVLDGRGLAAGTGVYPVWTFWQPSGEFDIFTTGARLYAISVEYDITQLA
jgi:hypothetical protein